MSLCRIKDLRADRGARIRVGMMECRGEKVGVGVRCPLTEPSDLKAEVFGVVDELMLDVASELCGGIEWSRRRWR